MDLGNSTVKTPETETETPTPTRIQPVKDSIFSNGVLKRHAPLNPHHHPVVVTYKECLKNHAASIGGHAVDGCGEFMPSPASNPSEPTSLKCAACGCHRNFHRREPEDSNLHPSPPPPPNALPALEYQPNRRHHPPPPNRENSGSKSSPNNSPSPPPISSSYYPSAPHMLLALSHGVSGPPPENNNNTPISISASPSGSRKRFRTKFTHYQKEKMLEFSGKVGWKMQKRDEDVINNFCNEIGVERGVFKVWMHNNKNTFGNKKDNPPPEATGNGNGVAYSHHHHGGDATESVRVQENSEKCHFYESTTAQALGTNGSSSSS